MSAALLRVLLQYCVCLHFSIGRILASALLFCDASYIDPVDAVAMVSRESTILANGKRKHVCHHHRLENVCKN